MDAGRLGYTAVILVLGLTMLATFAYSLFAFPERSVSDNMIHYPAYLGLLSACLVGHILTWGLYLHAYARHDSAAVNWGYAVLLTQAVGWVGLVTNLQGTTHMVFVGIFSAAHVVAMLILCHLVHDQDLSLLLRLSLIVALCCNILMLLLYDTQYFYLPEHVSFMFYSLYFTAFFCAQAYEDWGAYCALEE